MKKRNIYYYYYYRKSDYKPREKGSVGTQGPTLFSNLISCNNDNLVCISL